MKNMKNIVIACVACVLFALLAGCASSSGSASAGSTGSVSSAASPSASASASASSSAADTAESGVEVRIASLKGPTSIGIAKLMDDTASNPSSNDYDFAVSGTADEVLPNLIQGTVDIALIPANAAATVYAKTNGAVSVIDVNTLGVLYVVSGDSALTSIEDLAGKTVYMTGKGTTPDYVMSYLLDRAGIADDVTLEFKSEASEVAAVLAADASAIGVLPEPYVTSVTMKNPDLAARISLTQVWDELQAPGAESQLVTGVTVVRTAFLEEHPAVVDEFIDAQRASVEYALANPEATGELVVKAGIMDNAQAAAAAIPRCNLVCLTGEDMKAALSGYLEVLESQDPASVGGALPGSDFYYLP